MGVGSLTAWIACGGSSGSGPTPLEYEGVTDPIVIDEEATRGLLLGVWGSPNSVPLGAASEVSTPIDLLRRSIPAGFRRPGTASGIAGGVPVSFGKCRQLFGIEHLCRGAL